MPASHGAFNMGSPDGYYRTITRTFVEKNENAKQVARLYGLHVAMLDVQFRATIPQPLGLFCAGYHGVSATLAA